MTPPTLFTKPAFPASEPSSDPVTRFVPGTRIATPDGPRNVEMLAKGDRVTTRDGAKRIAKTGLSVVPRADWTFRRETWPVRVPVGSLGNPLPLRLSPDQRVLLSGPTVERICGTAEIWIALGGLIGLRGLIVERPLADLRYHGLSFGGPALIEVEGVTCAVEAEAIADGDREMAREAFQAMHAAGEPPLRTTD